jgi:hypothetical protein
MIPTDVETGPTSVSHIPSDPFVPVSLGATLKPARSGEGLTGSPGVERNISARY